MLDKFISRYITHVGAVASDIMRGRSGAALQRRKRRRAYLSPRFALMSEVGGHASSRVSAPSAFILSGTLLPDAYVTAPPRGEITESKKRGITARRVCNGTSRAER